MAWHGPIGPWAHGPVMTAELGDLPWQALAPDFADPPIVASCTLAHLLSCAQPIAPLASFTSV